MPAKSPTIAAIATKVVSVSFGRTLVASADIKHCSGEESIDRIVQQIVLGQSILSCRPAQISAIAALLTITIPFSS